MNKVKEDIFEPQPVETKEFKIAPGNQISESRLDTIVKIATGAGELTILERTPEFDRLEIRLKIHYLYKGTHENRNRDIKNVLAHIDMLLRMQGAKIIS